MSEQEESTLLTGDASNPIEFTQGLIGLEEWRQFVLISHPAGGALRLLQSLEDTHISFIVANPYQILPNYRLLLSAGDTEALQYAGQPGVVAPAADGLDVYCILSVQEQPFKVTANLLGPLVINWASGLGVQVILADTQYSARHLVADQPVTETPADAVEKVGEA